MACILAPAAMGANKKFTLVIDAGHGGKDTGAPGTMSVEKNINLNVALCFGRYVEQNCPDVRVVYTRKTDVFIPLYERAEIANRNKADLFISVHTNALKGAHTARGFETYTLGDGRSHAKETNLEVAKRENSVILLEKDYKQHYAGFDPNSPESNIMFRVMQDKNLAKSIDLAKMLQNHVCREAGRPNKGVHQQNLAVLRLTSMPACLIELGYISTPDEEQILNDKQKIDVISRAIYNAFAEYKNKYDKGFTVPFKTGSEPYVETSEEADNTKPTTRSIGSRDDEPDDATPALSDSANSRLSNPADRKTSSATVSCKEPSAERREAPKRQTPSRQATSTDETRPVFKVQILASSKKLKTNDSNFKQLEGITYYQEGGMYKYTYGASNNYNEIYRLRKEILDRFPNAFIIAFKNGEKINVNDGIREFKANRNKQR